MSAIEASSVRISTMADGTLRITLDVEPAHAQAAFALFGSPGTPVALAALKTAAQASQERAKGGEAARWLGMRCGEPEFQGWCAKQWPLFIPRDFTSGTDCASRIVRAVCLVNSRAEIDNDPAAFARFDTLIRKPWIAHSGGAA